MHIWQLIDPRILVSPFRTQNTTRADDRDHKARLYRLVKALVELQSLRLPLND